MATTGFTRINGTLAVDGIPLDEIAAEFGTPAFVYSASAIAAGYHRFQGSVDAAGGHVHYAVKANSNLAVLRLLANLGAGADIVSHGEMRRALAAGFPGSKIIFSGVGKKDAEIRAALEAGIGQINAESAAEIDRVLEIAADIPSSCRLALRVNPDVAADTHAKISTGKSDVKFGIAMAEVPALYRRIAESGVIAPGGLAVHIGSQIMDTAPFEHAWTALLDLAESLRAEGLDVPVLDLGGGLGVDYQTGEHADPGALGKVVTRLFGNRPYHLGFEPGRHLVAEAGVLVTEVIYTKDAPGKTFMIVDGAMNDLIRPTLYDAYHRIEPVIATSGETITADIVGPVCETGDYLGLGRQMPAMGRGDLLAVMSAGAYGAVMRSTYNTRPLAPEIMVIEGKAHRVSAVQTVDDLLGLDVIPAELG